MASESDFFFLIPDIKDICAWHLFCIHHMLKHMQKTKQILIEAILFYLWQEKANTAN